MRNNSGRKIIARVFAAAWLALMPASYAQQAENAFPLSDGMDRLSVSSSPVELPHVLLTPPIREVAGLGDFRIDLSGTWQFAHERPVPFFGKTEQVARWDELELPGHFALQGYEPLKSEIGRAVVYRKTFEVPKSWTDHAVMLRFGSIDGLVKLWVNERPVGSSDSAFLPVEFDISPYVLAGGINEISVSVEVSDLTGWYLRELGGMGRAVTLTALPTTHLSRLHIVDAIPNADGSGNLRIQFSLKNVSAERSNPSAVRLYATDEAGQEVEGSLTDVPLDALPSGATRDYDVSIDVADVASWNPESPRLYTLMAELRETDGGAAAMIASRSFGFRAIEIDGHQLVVNGRPIQLAGANYHLTHLSYGHFVPGDLIRRDLEILKQANLNALRAWPTPYREYVDACNEFGIFTTIEVPLNLQLYAPGPRKDHGNNPVLDRPYLELAARVLETYRSDPSVLMWGLANESIYYDYFQRAAVAIRKNDPTRPIFFGGDERMGVNIPGVQINDEHYPRAGVTTWEDPGNIQPAPNPEPPFGWQFPRDKPAISSEWLHLNINNRAQLLLDPGVDDYWGVYAKAHQDWTWRTPHFVGGFTFLAAPYRGLESKTPWRGFFDDHRRPTPYLWHMRKASSPVQLARLSIACDSAERKVRFTLTNRFNFTDFSEIEFIAQQGDVWNKLKLAAPPHAQAAGVLPWDPQGPPLTLTATAADGREIDRWVLVDVHPVFPTTKSSRPAVIVSKPRPDGSGVWRINTGAVDWKINAQTGLITQVTLGTESYPITGPRLTVRGHGHPNPDGTFGNITELCRDWQLEKIEVHQIEDRVLAVATGRYGFARGTLTTTFLPGDGVGVEYDFVWTWPTAEPFSLFDQGVAFTVPPIFDTLTWSRDALWSVYPEDHIGRHQGSAPSRGDERWISVRDDSPSAEKSVPVWPWSQDLTGPQSSNGQVTRDFRATRIHFHHGGLVNASGDGFFAIGDGTQHLRALPAADTAGLEAPPGTFTLQVNDYFEGGSDFHSTKSLYIDRRQLSPGKRLTGKSEWRWIRSNTDPVD